MFYMDLNCHIFSTLPLSIAQTYRTDKTVVNTYEENLSLQMIFSKKTDAQLKHPLFKKFLFIWKHPALTLTLPAYFNAASALTTNSHVRCVDEILNSSFVVWILFICGPNDTASSPGNLDAKIPHSSPA